MLISLQKFGTTLISRPAGKEAFLALRSLTKEINRDEKVEVDFAGVVVLTPSWADEFITPLVEQYGKRVALLNTKNPSVKATLQTLEKAKNNRR